MPQLNNLYVVANVAGECSYIVVTDDNLYPVTLDSVAYQQDELDYAIVLYLNGAFHSLQINGGSGWSFSIYDGAAWDVYIYACKVFETADKTGAGTEDTIYSRYGYFWQKLADVVLTSPGDDADPLEWSKLTTPLTDTVIASTFFASLITNNHGIGYKIVNTSPNCQGGYTIQQQDCHIWLANSNPRYTVVSVALYKYDGTLIDDTLVFDNNELIIELDEDGVYYLDIVTDTDLHFYVPIFDFCDAKTCYKNLFRYYMCACQDPCDEDCAETAKLAQREKDLKLIQGALMEIEMMVYLDRSQYFNYSTLSDTREAYITEVGVLIEKLKLATDRCGLCQDEESNDITC